MSDLVISDSSRERKRTWTSLAVALGLHAGVIILLAFVVHWGVRVVPPEPIAIDVQVAAATAADLSSVQSAGQGGAALSVAAVSQPAHAATGAASGSDFVIPTPQAAPTDALTPASGPAFQEAGGKTGAASALPSMPGTGACPRSRAPADGKGHRRRRRRGRRCIHPAQRQRGRRERVPVDGQSRPHPGGQGACGSHGRKARPGRHGIRHGQRGRGNGRFRRRRDRRRSRRPGPQGDLGQARGECRAGHSSPARRRVSRRGWESRVSGSPSPSASRSNPTARWSPSACGTHPATQTWTAPSSRPYAVGDSTPPPPHRSPGAFPTSSRLVDTRIFPSPRVDIRGPLTLLLK